MRLFIVIFLMCSLLLPEKSLNAQKIPYDLTVPVPVDPKVIIGKLDNGLTYYIRKNELPKNRAEFYLVVNVGAVQEDDDQNGLAHFCEHMAFNGTKNFAKHDIIRYLQSIGMKFGPEINAFTSHDVTNYMLQKVPLEKVENIDTALLILHDWAHLIAFEDEEIDKERGVIHEEWRLGRDAMFRMQKQSNKMVFHGSKYADRDIIGDINIIDKSPYDALKRFYRDWYCPDLQAIVAVGDFDVAVIEQKIKKQFSVIPKAQNSRKREIYPLPEHATTLISIEKDPEAPYTFVRLIHKQNVDTNKNLNYLRKSLVHDLFNRMMTSRLQEIIKQPESPFTYANTYYSQLVRSKSAFSSFALASNNMADAALKRLLVENERVRLHGFIATELARAKTELLREIESQYKERNKQESGRIIWEYYSHFLQNEPIPGIEFEYDFAQKVVPFVTLAEINALPTQWISEKNRVVTINGPENPNVKIPTEQDVLNILAGIKNEKILPYVDKVIDKALLEKLPKKGTVKMWKYNSNLGFTEWTMQNGIKVIVKSTDFKEDEIIMNSYSFGGYSLYSLQDNISAKLAAQVMQGSGLGDFSSTDLEKMLAGKIVSINPAIDELSEGLKGTCSPADIETFMQLLYLSFTAPRSDSGFYASFINRRKGMFENKNMNPNSAFYDTITVTLTQNHPMVKLWDAEVLKEADFNRIQKIYKERFTPSSDFVFTFVGNIDTAKFKFLAEMYIGGLQTTGKPEQYKDLGVRPPKLKVDKKYKKEMKEPKASVFIGFTGEYDYSLKNRILISAINEILKVRYIETIREEESGTYGVQVGAYQNKYPYSNYQFNISFNCAPENAEKLAQVAIDEIKKIIDNGIEEKYLNNFKENKFKEMDEMKRQNRFWSGLLYSMYFNNMPEYTIVQNEEMTKSITVKDVQDAMKRFVNVEKYIRIIQLPE